MGIPGYEVIEQTARELVERIDLVISHCAGYWSILYGLILGLQLVPTKSSARNAPQSCGIQEVLVVSA